MPRPTRWARSSGKWGSSSSRTRRRDDGRGRLLSGRVPGLVLLLLGLAAAELARRLPGQTGFGLGPAFLPFWTGLVLAGCGVWLCLWPGSAGDGAARTDRPVRARAVAGFVTLLVYALALEPLGYLLSTAVFLAGGILLLAPERPGRALALGAGGAALLLLVFRVWLRVPLPGGFLGV